MAKLVISCNNQQRLADVVLRSPDGKSLAASYDGLFLGYAGMIALVWNDDINSYVDLLFGNEVNVLWLN